MEKILAIATTNLRRTLRERVALFLPARLPDAADPRPRHGFRRPRARRSSRSRSAGATLVDPRPYAVGSIVTTYERYPSIGAVLPAMGYGDAQLADLASTIQATPCDAVIIGTPMNLGRLVDLGHPARRVSYEYRDADGPTLAGILAPYIAKWQSHG